MEINLRLILIDPVTSVASVPRPFCNVCDVTSKPRPYNDLGEILSHPAVTSYSSIIEDRPNPTTYTTRGFPCLTVLYAYYLEQSPPTYTRLLCDTLYYTYYGHNLLLSRVTVLLRGHSSPRFRFFSFF